MGRPQSWAMMLAALPPVFFLATFFSNERILENSTRLTRRASGYSSLHNSEMLHSTPVFDSCRVFDVPEEEIAELGLLHWPLLGESSSSVVAHGVPHVWTWTERVPPGVMITRYISEGTVQLNMRNEVSSSGRFMGAGSLVDIVGPVTLIWAPKHDGERVVIRAPRGQDSHKIWVALGAFTVLFGALLARGLSSSS